MLKPGKLLFVTSGTGLTDGGPGHLRVESDPPERSRAILRQPEQAASAAAKRGVIVHPPQVHHTRKQGLVPLFDALRSREGVAAYVGDGANRWTAAPLEDVAHLYCLGIEQARPGVTVYHAVQEEGVTSREIAGTLGKGLKVPAASIDPDKAAEHFGWFALRGDGHACVGRVDAQDAGVGSKGPGLRT